jgi:hypothetical protein
MFNNLQQYDYPHLCKFSKHGKTHKNNRMNEFGSCLGWPERYQNVDMFDVFLSKNRHATVCVITTYGDRPKIEMCTLTSGWRALKLHQHVCIHFVFPWGDTFTHKHAYLVSTCFNYDWWLVLLKPQWNNLKQFLRVGAGERCVFRYLLLARSFCKKNNHSCVFDNKSCPRAAPQFFTDIAAPRIFISKGPRFTILRYYCIIL